MCNNLPKPKVNWALFARIQVPWRDETFQNSDKIDLCHRETQTSGLLMDSLNETEVAGSVSLQLTEKQ